jgi:hypothetical protein
MKVIWVDRKKKEIKNGYFVDSESVEILKIIQIICRPSFFLVNSK